VNSVRDSKYFKGLRMIPKEKFTYVDHNFELYKNKTIQNTYVIILSNSESDLSNLNAYDFETFPGMANINDTTANSLSDDNEDVEIEV
jgi:hypothetical protein